MTLQETGKIKSSSMEYTDKYYRVTHNGIGIYEAFRQEVGEEMWNNFLDSPMAEWLPKLDKYLDEYKRYFTEEGYDMFQQRTWTYMIKYVGTMKIETYTDLPNNIIYKDKYQVIIDN